MKSKKIVALALTAAMAISMASMTAFAGTKYVDGSEPGKFDQLQATVTLTKDQYTKAVKDGLITGDTGSEKSVTIANLASIDDEFTLNYTKLNTGTKTFKAWSTDGGDKSAANAVVTDMKTTAVELTLNTSDDDKYATVTLKAEYTTTTDDEQIAKNLKAINDAADKEKAAKSRDEELEAGDKANKAVDNVKTDKGPKTEKAPVSGPEAIDKFNDKHDFKVVNDSFGDSTLAWVYEVSKPVGLVSSYNARVTLPAPEGYNPKDYKVAVYHIKGYCTAEKVKGLNIGKNDVTFWANDMSPYVLVLTPKDAVAGTSTGNPSTGDFSAVPVAMLAAAALGATGFVAYKKRKAE